MKRTHNQPAANPAPAAAPKSPAGAPVVAAQAIVDEPPRNDWAKLSERACKREMIPLAKLERDPELNCRAAGVSDDLVRKYAEAAGRGSKFPAVIVFRDADGKNWLADGFHRCAAVEMRQGSEVQAEVREGSREEALLYAAGANAARGLGRTNADKRRAALALLALWSNKSDAWIALQCGVSDRFVAKLRPRDPNGSGPKREGRDGKVKSLPKTVKGGAAEKPEKRAKIARRELERVSRRWPKGMALDPLVAVAREWLATLETKFGSSPTRTSTGQEAARG